MATPNMSLVLPTVSVTLGPEWATELNTALELVDAHDHTSGKGLAIKTAALDIDNELSLQSNRLLDATSLQLISAVSPVSGVGEENSLSVANGDLYYTNGAGIAVQITDGDEVLSPTPVLNELPHTSVNTDLIIGSGDSYVVLSIDMSSPRTITLPAANAVNAGRFYVLKDATLESETNNLTIAPAGSDTIDSAASLVVASDGASVVVVSDGVSNWEIW